jgi:hypothetical protein
MARAMTFLGIVAAIVAVAAGASDSVTITLSNTIVQPQEIPQNFVGFSIEVSSALKQLSINGIARRSYGNLMVRLDIHSQRVLQHI